jgi:hypothetical protein
MAEDIKFEASGFVSLKTQIREANLAYQALLADVNATPAAIAAAAQKVGDLKDRFDDANDAVNAMTSAGRIQAFTKGISALAGGFTAINGAMALAGDSGKELQETMVKLQGAIALTQGITALEDIPNAFKNIKTAGVSAFTAIKAAIGATGIGLLLVGLGAIAAYWDEISAAVSGVTEEQEKLNEASAANLKTQQNQLDSISQQENILKLQGKSEEDILNMKVAQTNQVIKAAEVNIANMETTKKAQVEASQRNQDILQGIIRFLTAPLDMLLYTIDQVGKALGKDFGLEEAFSGGLAKLVFDPADVAKEADKTIEEAKKGLVKLKNDQAGYQLQIKEIHKKGAAEIAKQREEDGAKAKAEEEKRLKEQKELLDKTFKEALESYKQYTTDLEKFKKDKDNAVAVTDKQKRAKEFKDLSDHYDDLIAEAKRLGQSTTELQDAKFVALGMANAKYIQEDKDANAAAAADTLSKAEQTAQRELDIKEAKDQFIQDSTLSLLDSLATLNEIYDKKSEEESKKAFERSKALAIAETLISTYFAAQRAYQSQFVPIAEISSPFRATVAAGLAIVSGLARVASISQQQFSFSGGSSSTSSAPPQSTPSTYADGGLLMGNSHNMGGIRTAMGELEGGEFVVNRRATANFLPLLESINSLGNVNAPEVPMAQQPIVKTYVVATDMSSQQEANARLNALARL